MHGGKMVTIVAVRHHYSCHVRAKAVVAGKLDTSQPTKNVAKLGRRQIIPPLTHSPREKSFASEKNTLML